MFFNIGPYKGRKKEKRFKKLVKVLVLDSFPVSINSYDVVVEFSACVLNKKFRGDQLVSILVAF